MVKVLPTICCVKLIDKKKFVETLLDEISETFFVDVLALKAPQSRFILPKQLKKLPHYETSL